MVISRSSARPVARHLLVVATLALLAAGLTPAVAPAAARVRRPSAAPVADEVKAELAASGQTTFWVRFEDRPSLTRAATMGDWAVRGQAVVDELQRNTEESQAAVRDLLSGKGVGFTTFWAANAMKVTAGAEIVDQLAAQPGVAEIAADRKIVEPTATAPAAPTGSGTAGPDEAAVQAVEWNIDRVRAPEVWSQLGTRGEGIVVGSIDSGVQYDHPALVGSYRGNRGGGVFDHDYNWFDPTGRCGQPAPCDPPEFGGGSLTMGVVVGDDGAGNQIGVAPGARWMTAAPCDLFGCSIEDILDAAEWMLAPTDLDGANPRPDLRPNVLVTSFHSQFITEFFPEVIDAWEAAGIFPMLSFFGSGGCGDIVPPQTGGRYVAGAFDEAGNIAAFSPHGPGADGEVEPDLSAPGVDIRTSAHEGYVVTTWISLPPAHVVGTVALMWSAAPLLVGDVEATRALLDETAVDRSDLTCGGTPGDNNVWGEGQLDAFRAVERSPRNMTGTLAGVVTDAATGAPVPAGTPIEVTGPIDRTAFTDADGAYSVALVPGPYTVTADVFGFEPFSEEVTITVGETTTLDIALTGATRHTVSGTVTDGGGPAFDAVVTVVGGNLAPVTTGADGAFTILEVPAGEQEITVANRCLVPETRTVVVDGDVTVDFALERRRDEAGNTCEHVPADYVEGDVRVPVSDFSPAVITLPFDFWFYDRPYTTAHVTAHGYLSFDFEANRLDRPIPDPARPNNAIYAFAGGTFLADSVYTAVVGEAPDRVVVLEWRDVRLGAFDGTVDFEVKLHENGDIELQYRDIDDDPQEQGEFTTVGLENATGTDAFTYSVQEPSLRSGLGVRFVAPPAGFVTGRVTDGNDGTPVEGAVVRAFDDTGERTAITAADGTYRLRLRAGSHTVQASLLGDGMATATVVIDEPRETVTADFALPLPRIGAAPDRLDVTSLPDRTETRTVTVGNAGVGPLGIDVRERPRPAAGTSDVLVIRDILPFPGGDSLALVLAAAGLSSEQIRSPQLAGTDLSAYQVVIAAENQPTFFYDNIRAAQGQLTEYVEDGGFLWMSAGHSFSTNEPQPLPGGASYTNLEQRLNDVAAPEHPGLRGVAGPLGPPTQRSLVSSVVYGGLPEGTTVIMRAYRDPRPTMIEYGLGAGRVLASAQEFEPMWWFGGDPRRVYESLMSYVGSFDPDLDVPWLSVAPTGTTVTPGGSAELTVSIDTTGLAPGVHRARLALEDNDPVTPKVRIPLTVVVPGYQVAVDVGGTSPFTDAAGDVWAADQRHTAGSWGYTNGRSSRLATLRAIALTDDDRLFQTARNNPVEYRFDGVPNGVFEVEFRFAEINGRRPNRRVFDVAVEHQFVLALHDISGEVGTFTADQHTVFAQVTDGQLNVRFGERQGFGVPIVNGLRVTHRPDL